MKVEFECWPIETAPKDREIMGIEMDGDRVWTPIKWTDDHDGGWVQDGEFSRTWMGPTHWAELKDMVPKEEA